MQKTHPSAVSFMLSSHAVRLLDLFNFLVIYVAFFSELQQKSILEFHNDTSDEVNNWKGFYTNVTKCQQSLYKDTACCAVPVAHHCKSAPQSWDVELHFLRLQQNRTTRGDRKRTWNSCSSYISVQLSDSPLACDPQPFNLLRKREHLSE